MIVLHARTSPGVREAVDAILGPGVVGSVLREVVRLRWAAWSGAGNAGGPVAAGRP